MDRKSVGMGVSQSRPGPSCGLVGRSPHLCQFRAAVMGPYDWDIGIFLLLGWEPRVKNLVSTISPFEVPAHELTPRSVEVGDTQAIFRQACFLDTNIKYFMTDVTDTRPLPSSEPKEWDKLLSTDKHRGQEVKSHIQTLKWLCCINK